jgi:hypothetical protein
VGLERCLLSLVRTTDEVPGREISGSGLESHADHGTLYPQNLALSSPTSSGRSVGTVPSPIHASESLVCDILIVNGIRTWQKRRPILL